MLTISVDEAQRAAAAFETLSAATVHEAYGRRGALDPAIKPIVTGRRVCGPAMTVRTAPGSNLLLHQALYHTPPGWILMAATDESRDFGYWGDVMTAAATRRGLGGVIIDGGVRDLAELRASSLPIFSTGHTIRGTVKVQEGEIGAPIVVGGVTVTPGDIVVGDDDGLVCVALEQALQVAAASRAREDKEVTIKTAIAAGQTTPQPVRLRPGAAARGTAGLISGALRRPRPVPVTPPARGWPVSCSPRHRRGERR